MSGSKSRQRTVEPRYVQIEADMLARATKHIIDSGDYVEADGLAALLGAANLTAARLRAWERQGLIFAFTHVGMDYYPRYAFLREPLVAPHPAIAQIIKIFDRKDGRRLSFWFASVNGWLDGLRPMDILVTEPDTVIVAAKREKESIQHG